MNKKIIFLAASAAGFAAMGIDNKLGITEYTIHTPKIKRKAILAFISDLHSQKFKDGGAEFFDKIDSTLPDALIIGGDLFDKHGKSEAEYKYVLEFAERLSVKFKNTCFVCGNHELEHSNSENICDDLASQGVRHLGNKPFSLSSEIGQQIDIFGVDYSPDGYSSDYVINPDAFSVLVRHVPFRMDDDKNFDLILSGHNHGGLWRLPKLNIGAAGGGGRIFPKYSRGMYSKESPPLIVSSGVTTQTYLLPRLYNPPEIVKVTLIPDRRYNFE